MVNQASQQCLRVGPLGSGGVTVPGCMARGTDFAKLTSVWGDGYDSTHGAYARVAISQNVPNDPQGRQMCLQADGPATGPNGNGSSGTTWVDCFTEDGREIWDMWTAAPPQNVGNPAGLKHFIGFYNEATHTCLDGGIGVYGFSASDCSKTNNWQIWNIYTDWGSY